MNNYKWFQDNFFYTHNRYTQTNKLFNTCTLYNIYYNVKIRPMKFRKPMGILDRPRVTRATESNARTFQVSGVLNLLPLCYLHHKQSGSACCYYLGTYFRCIRLSFVSERDSKGERKARWEKTRQEWRTADVLPFWWSSMRAARARDPRILSLSDTTDGVMSL